MMNCPGRGSCGSCLLREGDKIGGAMNRQGIVHVRIVPSVVGFFKGLGVLSLLFIAIVLFLSL